MPELAAAYFAGLVVCLISTIVFVMLVRARRKSDAYENIKTNLRRAQLYWSENTDRITEWSAEVENEDVKTSEKTIGTTGALLSLLSWAGFAFLLIIMISYRFLAQSRLEKALFASPLASDQSLSEVEIRHIAASFHQGLQPTTT